MFFKLHKEGKIGYKQLTEADLGRAKGNTSHIGLFGDVLTFLPDEIPFEEALFLYNDTSQNVPYYFDRIYRKNGIINSPKIRKGGKNVVSVTTLVQDIANKISDTKKWYLLWFGLESEKIVFYLFNSSSDEFNKLSEIIDLQKPKIKQQVNLGDENFNKLLLFIENYVNKNTSEVLQELEIASQIGTSKKHKAIDLKKANKLFEETGKKGEELIANYLDFLKSTKQIFNFTWYNKNLETGLPYDFSIQENNQTIIYLDVKSTKYRFEQDMIFSSQEIEFIDDTPNYSIYRVFDLSDDIEVPKLKICDSSKELASSIYRHIQELRGALKLKDVSLKSTKLAIKPTNNLLNFSSIEIELNH